ncbi:MAG: sigma-70 family RNA polymerase sigma factor [Candidatus Aminicenantales bacterium]
MKLDELYDRYGEKMYHYLALRLGSSEDAEDVLQDAFCRLAKYSVRWTLVRNPEAFVFKVLRNEANRHLARRIRQREDGQKYSEREIRPVFAIDNAADNSATVISQALSRLPDDQKEIIILKVFQDFTFKEVASVCGLSINTAASRYRYGIEKLRASLEGKV